MVLTDEAWDHIVTRRVGAPPTLEAIRAAVESPDFMTADADYSRRECFYRHRLKVVVTYGPVPPQGTWAGEVVTAYRARGTKPGEEQLWP